MDQLGDYRLLEALATGTTGRVFAASRWPALGDHYLFAVKLVESELARNERFVLLLHESAAAFAHFEHPGVVPVFETTRVSDHLVLVSELVDGQPLDRVLRQWFEQGVDVDPALWLWIAARVASTLAAAHGSGLVHGHLSPDQILLTYQGEVRLLGLGRGEARGVLSPAEVRRGFLAPEVLRTANAAPTSDVHSLARILHHALAGTDSTLGGGAAASVNDAAWLPPLRSYGVVIHPAVESMVESMLAASPNARPSFDEVEAALQSAVGNRSTTMRSTLSRLVQRTFQTEVAAALLRRKRIARGPDDVTARNDAFVPRLAGRALADDGPDAVTPPPTGRSGGLGNRAEGSGAGTSRGADARPTSNPSWIDDEEVDELSPTAIYNSVIRHAAAAKALERTRATEGDPTSRAFESNDPTAIDALVDEIVRRSTPPMGVVREAEPRLPLATFAADDVEDTKPMRSKVPPLAGPVRQLADPPEPSSQPGSGDDPLFADGGAFSTDDPPPDSGGMVYPVPDYGRAAAPPRRWPPDRAAPEPAGSMRRSNAEPPPRPRSAPLRPHATPPRPQLTPPRPQPAPTPPRAFSPSSGDRAEPIMTPPSLLPWRGGPTADRAPPAVPQPISGEDTYASDRGEGGRLPLPEPMPPEAIFSDDLPRLPSGTVIGERYKIEDVIGEGGVSVVYRCSHSFLRKDVAIKVLRPELATMPPVVERFHREARSVAQLDHPNIVRVIDFGKSNTGSLFLVMDLIEGVSLADEIEREGYLAPTAAVRVVVSILTGLEHAHGRGVIHRDLKPDNIMLVAAESGPTEVKILDFGIAKLGDVEIGSRPITEAGMVFGTPRYMSPEQAAGEPVDHRSDLFAVGIILYQLLSGQLPFDGDTTVQILRRVLTQPAPRLRVNGLPSATSEALADVVALALAKSPEQRYPSARRMREALQACFPL